MKTLSPKKNKQVNLILFILLFFIVPLCFFSCSDSPEIVNEDIIFETCDSTRYRVRLGDRIAIGPSSNFVGRSHENSNEILIVESGSNTLSKLKNNAKLVSFIDVGDEHNPWSFWGDSNFIYTTNYLSNSVSEFTIQGERVKEWKEGFDRPTSILGNQTHLFISNVVFDGTVFQKGFILVFDRQTQARIQKKETKALNPQFLSFINVGNETSLAIINSGSFKFSNEGTLPGSDASLEIWKLKKSGKEILYQGKNFPLPLEGKKEVGSPGRPIQIRKKIYFSSGTAPVLFEFDLEKMQWTRNTKNPIVLRDPLPDALHFMQGWNSLLFITAFNEDAIYIVDPQCEKIAAKITIDNNEFLAGPHEIIVFSSGENTATGYFILSLANALGTFEIEKLYE